MFPVHAQTQPITKAIDSDLRTQCAMRDAKQEGPGAQELAQKTSALMTSIKRLLREFRIIRRTLVHPEVPWHAKLVAGFALLYLVSPIQLIPNFIPIIGQTDDVVVVMLAMRYLRKYVPKGVLRECENDSRKVPVAEVGVSSVTGPLPYSKS